MAVGGVKNYNNQSEIQSCSSPYLLKRKPWMVAQDSVCFQSFLVIPIIWQLWVALVEAGDSRTVREEISWGRYFNVQTCLKPNTLDTIVFQNNSTHFFYPLNYYIATKFKRSHLFKNYFLSFLCSQNGRQAAEIICSLIPLSIDYNSLVLFFLFKPVL